MPIERNGKILYTVEDLKPLVEGNAIIDGTSGGLILGNYHSEGGIKVIRQCLDEKLYDIVAEFESWEYILSPMATTKNLEYIKRLNSEFKGETLKFIEYEIPETVNILDTRPMFENDKNTNKLIIIGEYPQFIVNKYSTKKYLNELNKINIKYSR